MRFIIHFLARILVRNTFNFENAFKIMEHRKWDYFYVYVDIHGTVLLPDYEALATEYYPMAKEVLKRLSDDSRIKLCLYTCSHPNEIEFYVNKFSEDGIHFDFINRADDVVNTRGGNFQDKPYMNVLLEDKAGFIGEYDWRVLDFVLKKYKV